MVLLSPLMLAQPETALGAPPAEPAVRPVATWRSVLLFVLLGALAGSAFAVWERQSAPAPPPQPRIRVLAV